MEKTKVYGCSDDLVIIEGAPYPADEIGCFDSVVRIGFSDGTIIKACYGKNHKGIWLIEIIEKGTAAQTINECDDEDAEIYSDIFEIEAEYDWHEVEDKQ